MTLLDIRPAHPYLGRHVQQFATGVAFRSIAEAARLIASRDECFEVTVRHHETIRGKEWACILVLKDNTSGGRLIICSDGTGLEVSSYTSLDLNNSTASTWLSELENQMARDSQPQRRETA